jgi:hypothetical protein
MVGSVLFDLPEDAVLTWSLEPPSEGPAVDLLRIGSCESRAALGAHTVLSPMGFPKAMAEHLAEHGVGFGYQSFWSFNFNDLPQGEEDLRRRRRRRRPPPDVVWIQVGAAHALRQVLGFDRRAMGIRENVGRALGPGIGPAWRGLELWLRLVGTTIPYDGVDPLRRLVGDLRVTWPDARIGIQELFNSALRGALDESRLQHIIADQRALARELGLDWIPRPDLGRDMRLRCANGGNLNAAGSVVAGRHYGDWLLEHGVVFERRRSEAA